MTSKESIVAKVEWWRVSWKRVTMGLAVPFGAVLLLGACWLLIQPLIKDVFVWKMVRDVARENPKVNLFPQPLGEGRIADLHGGATITRFGYTMQFPWDKIVFQKDYKFGTSLGFDAGASALIHNPDERQDLITPIFGTAKEKEDMRRGMRAMLGGDTTASDFQFISTAMRSLPDEVSLFHSRNDNLRLMMLVNTKEFELPSGATKIYTIHSGALRGFQFSDPQTPRRLVELLLFDSQDRAIQINLKGPKDQTMPALSQPQINAIIASIHRATQ
jgi:hypothetical protein